MNRPDTTEVSGDLKTTPLPDSCRMQFRMVSPRCPSIFEQILLSLDIDCELKSRHDIFVSKAKLFSTRRMAFKVLLLLSILLRFRADTE
jgi:hypothetical protein